MKKLDNLFIHIPKTGGQSVYQAIGQNTKPHKSIQEMKRRMREDTFVFTIVRNPYDRAVSLYHWFEQLHLNKNIRRVPYNAAWNAVAKACEDVNEFWLRFLTEESFEYQCRHQVMFRPQMDFICKAEDKNAIAPRLSKIIKFENLQEEWEELRSSKSFKKLPHKNSSKRKGWEEELNEESKKRIAKLYARDFKQLPYSK